MKTVGVFFFFLSLLSCVFESQTVQAFLPRSSSSVGIRTLSSGRRLLPNYGPTKNTHHVLSPSSLSLYLFLGAPPPPPQLYSAQWCLPQCCPLATQMLTAALCAVLGDCLAQFKEQQQKWMSLDDSSSSSKSVVNDNYDPVRTFHFFLKGLGGGLVWAQWFAVADDWSNALVHRILLVFPMSDNDETTVTSARIAASIFLEQFLASPLLLALWDLPLPALLAGSPPRTVAAQVRAKLPALWVANAQIWTPVNAITYSLPVEYRVLFSSMADMFWQAVISEIATRDIVVGEDPAAVASALPVLLRVEEDVMVVVQEQQQPVMVQQLLLSQPTITVEQQASV